MMTPFDRWIYHSARSPRILPDIVQCKECIVILRPGPEFQLDFGKLCQTCQNTRIQPIPLTELRGAIGPL